MALANNLQKYNFPSGKSKFSQFFKKNRKAIVIGLIILSVLLGIYGIINLIRLAPKEQDRQDLVYETGDQPLEQKIMIIINAKGGLNMREEPNTGSKILKIIPDKTKLEATLVEGDWYQVNYDGKTGWVNKQFITISTGDEAPVTTEAQKYQNTTYGFSLTYPADWVKMDYGANKASGLESYIGFGIQLSDEIDSSVLAPIAVKITKDDNSTVNDSYKAKESSTSAKSTISGLSGTKYVFTSSLGVQMTAYVVSSGGYTYILEESGGYADELASMVKSFKLL